MTLPLPVRGAAFGGGLLLLCALPWTAPLSAQNAGVVRGVVVDRSTSAPMAGINAQALGTRASVLTDERGAYTLRDLPAGPVTIRFSWLGYREHEVVVDVVAGGVQVLDVAMEITPIPLGEIRVTTVSRHAERIVESPAAVATVEPGRIRDVASTGQAPLIVADIPGVHVMQSGVNSFNVNARAFNDLVNRRLLVLVDGRDASAAFANSPEWPTISVVEDAARVEFIRGPGSALYGANAFSGVLNIVTPHVRQAQGTRLTVGGGSGSSMNADGRYGVVSDDLRWGLGLSGGYASTVSWDRSRTDLGDLAAEYAPVGPLQGDVPQPGFELVPLAGQGKSTPFGVPGPVTGDPDPMITMRGSARVDHYLSNGGAVTAEGGATRVRNQVNASAASRAQIRESTVPWARLAFDTDRFNAMAYYSARTGDQANLATGADYEDQSSRMHVEAQTNAPFADDRGRVVVGASARRETVDSRGSVLAPAYDGRSDTYYGVFGQVEFDVTDMLRVVLVGRSDASSLFDAVFSPRAALVFSPSQSQTLRVTYGQAFLTPSVTQRFVRFPLGPPADLSMVEAALRASPLGPALLGVPSGTLFTNSSAVPVLTIGDENLRPEEVRSFEVGYKGQTERLFIEVDAHYSDFQNFFTGLLPGVHPDFGPWTAPTSVPDAARAGVEAGAAAIPGLTRLEDGSTAILYAGTNAGAATQVGVDLSAAFQATEQFRLQASYSFVAVDFEEGSLLGGDAIAANTPTHTGSASATYARPDGLRVRLGVSLVKGFDFQTGVWKGAVPGRQSVDVSARRRLTDQVSAGVSVTNVFDQKRYHYFGGSLIGRRLLASLTWEP